MMKGWIAILALSWTSVLAENLPPELIGLKNADGWANVRDFGAVGDGVTDDTVAIQSLISSRYEKGNNALVWGGLVLYFPEGEYLVSDSLVSAPGPRLRIFVGDGEKKTIIRLADRAPGFDDPDMPKPILATFPPESESTARMGNSFNNAIYDLTVDSGEGNPGAIGVYFQNNNQGFVRDVTIRSKDGSGHAGLAMRVPWPGPGHFSGITVEGFQYGIECLRNQYSLTFENIFLKGQKKAGFRISGQLVFARGIETEGLTRAVSNDQGSLVVLDSQFLGGSGGAAIVSNGGTLLARNIQTSGYRSSLVSRGKGPGEITESTVTEFASQPETSSARSLGLSIRETPDGLVEPFTQWTCIDDFDSPVITIDQNGRAVEVADTTPALQAAIDAGATTIFFPRRDYYFSDTVILRNSIARLNFCHSRINLDPSKFLDEAPDSGALFRLEDGDAPVVVFEHFIGPMGPNKQRLMIQASERDLVVRHGGGRVSGVQSEKPGSVFIEDVVGGKYNVIPGQKVWMRQVNTEGKTGPRIVNEGGDLWILGMKTEGPGTNLRLNAGSRTELLGAYFYPYNGTGEAPCIILEEGAQFSGSWHTSGARYEVQLLERKADGSEVILIGEGQARGGRSSVLFSTERK